MGRGRPYDFPGLQEKFEQALLAVLTEKKSGPEILAEIGGNLKAHGISYAEWTDLNSRSPNYFRRAKDHGIIQSNGPHAGYTLAQVTPQLQVPGAAPPASAVPPSEDGAGETTSQHEGLLHFAATMVLANHFKGVVTSLPKRTDGLSWGNPDLLVVSRDSIADELRGAGIPFTWFAKVSTRPELIVRSCELKFGIFANRTKLATAISECGLNSSWANEAWLVVFEESGYSPIDSDVLAHARATGVGLLHVGLQGNKPENYRHELTRVCDATLRGNIGTANLARRTNLMQVASDTIDEFSKYGSFLDEKAVVGHYKLLRTAFKNLRKQVGLRDRSSLEQQLANRSSLAARSTIAALNWLATELALPNGADTQAVVDKFFPKGSPLSDDLQFESRTASLTTVWTVLYGS